MESVYATLVLFIALAAVLTLLANAVRPEKRRRGRRPDWS